MKIDMHTDWKHILSFNPFGMLWAKMLLFHFLDDPPRFLLLHGFQYKFVGRWGGGTVSREDLF